jgi:hypothetical protein
MLAEDWLTVGSTFFVILFGSGFLLNKLIILNTTLERVENTSRIPVNRREKVIIMGYINTKRPYHIFFNIEGDGCFSISSDINLKVNEYMS